MSLFLFVFFMGLLDWLSFYNYYNKWLPKIINYGINLNILVENLAKNLLPKWHPWWSVVYYCLLTARYLSHGEMEATVRIKIQTEAELKEAELQAETERIEAELQAETARKEAEFSFKRLVIQILGCCLVVCIGIKTYSKFAVQIAAFNSPPAFKLFVQYWSQLKLSCFNLFKYIVSFISIIMLWYYAYTCVL